MSSLIITSLLALSSPIDQNVKLVVQKPVPGSAAWDQVVFDDYCYQKLNDPARTEVRTRAMADIFGKAAALLAKEDPQGNFSLRTYSRNQKGEERPRLHISIRPTTSSGTTMDVNAELAETTQRLAQFGYDFNQVPAPVAANSAAYLGFLKSALARAGATAVNSEMAESSTEDEAPDI